MAKKRHMTALQRKYFGKGHRVVHRRTRVVSVARRRSGRRYYARARSYGRRARRGFGGKFGGIIPPVAGGALDSVLSNVSLPIIGNVPNGAGAAIVGHFMHNQVTRDIGLYQIGQALPGMIGLGATASTTGLHPRQ